MIVSQALKKIAKDVWCEKMIRGSIRYFLQIIALI